MTAMEFNSKLINMEQRLERFALSLTANREAAKDLVTGNLSESTILKR